MNFVFKMMNFVFKMMICVQAMARFINLFSKPDPTVSVMVCKNDELCIENDHINGQVLRS